MALENHHVLSTQIQNKRDLQKGTLFSKNDKNIFKEMEMSKLTRNIVNTSNQLGIAAPLTLSEYGRYGLISSTGCPYGINILGRPRN
jgi:hypothetical protein